MAFSRGLTVRAEPETCWSSMTDVPQLVSWVSILQDAQEIAHLDRYTAVLMDRVGPFKLRADLGIEVSELRPYEHLRVVAAGEDRAVASRLAVDAGLSLAPQSHGCRITLEGTYEVVGKLATLGGAVIKQKANRILDDFFAHVGRELGVVP